MSPHLVSGKPNDDITAQRSGSVRDVLKRGVGFYKLAALIFVNVIITLIVFNLFCDVVNKIWENQRHQQEDRLCESLFTDKYHDFTVPQFRELLKEKRRPRLYEFEPYLGYKFRPVWLKYTHVTAAGFRWSTDNGPWPPSPSNLNIFVYGASTTFGVGVTDEQTIPAQLQEFLKGKSDRPIKVYNFGTPSYNSTTERVQFANMLAQGLKPDVAVFVDGNLDSWFWSDEPPLSGEMRELMEDRGYGLLKAIRPFFHELPMAKLGKTLRETQSKKTAPANRVRFTPAQLDHIIARYTANKRLIEVQAREFGVRTLFVWQPCTSYHFDPKYNPYPEPDYSPVFMVPTYERVAQKVKDGAPEFTRDFLWLGDIQEGVTEPCYLDSSQHYRPSFCKKIGTAIGQSLVNRHMLVKDTTPPVEPPKR